MAEAVIAALDVEPLALLLGGSHAVGEAVWVDTPKGRVTTSDLDLWALLPDAAARTRAGQALARHADALRAAAAELGVVAPVEVTVLDPRTLAALEPRPATLELRARGVTLAGDPGWLGRVPEYTAASVPREEWLVLLENRAFELLWASASHDGDPLDGLKTRHAIAKVALDLAAVLALSCGELPMGAAARVAWARARLESDRSLAALVDGGLETVWDEALSWRAGTMPMATPAETRIVWRRVVRAWVAMWRHVSGARNADPIAHAEALARRAPWPRRLRRSLGFAPALAAPTLAHRLTASWRGTPTHRLGAAAVVMLLAADHPDGPPVLGAPARGALRRLAVLDTVGDWAATARGLVARWDAWVLEGRRGTVAA